MNITIKKLAKKKTIIFLTSFDADNSSAGWCDPRTHDTRKWRDLLLGFHGLDSLAIQAIGEASQEKSAPYFKRGNSGRHNRSWFQQRRDAGWYCILAWSENWRESRRPRHLSYAKVVARRLRQSISSVGSKLFLRINPALTTPKTENFFIRSQLLTSFCP